MATYSSFEPPIFDETQRFARVWFWVVALATAPVAALQAYGTYQQLALGRPWGNHPASNQGLLWVDLLVLLACGGTLWIVSAARLEVHVTRELLDVNFFPLRHKRIRLADILDARPRSFSPIAEFGGWGLRWSVLGNGWGYFMRGSEGVQLILADGKKMLVGSQQPERLASVLQQLRPAAAPQTTMFKGSH